MPLDPDIMATILEQPQADGPRAALSDWLDEHGDTARAEFIRVQLKLSELLQGWKPENLDCLDLYLDPDDADDQEWKHRVWALWKRERELLDRHVGAWLPPIFASTTGVASAPPPTSRRVRVYCSPSGWVEFRRGFIDLVHCTWYEWRHCHADFLAAAPITVVELEDFGPPGFGWAEPAMSQLLQQWYGRNLEFRVPPPVVQLPAAPPDDEFAEIRRQLEANILESLAIPAGIIRREGS